MKTFKFKFEMVLKVREQQLRLAEIELSRRKKELAVAERHLGTVDQQIREHLETAKSAQDKVASAATYRDREDGMRFLRESRQRALRAVEEVRPTFAEAANVCKELSAKVEGLQSLRADAWRAYQAEAEKQSQTQLDDHVMRTWSP